MGIVNGWCKCDYNLYTQASSDDINANLTRHTSSKLHILQFQSSSKSTLHTVLCTIQMTRFLALLVFSRHVCFSYLASVSKRMLSCILKHALCSRRFEKYENCCWGCSRLPGYLPQWSAHNYSRQQVMPFLQCYNKGTAGKYFSFSQDCYKFPLNTAPTLLHFWAARLGCPSVRQMMRVFISTALHSKLFQIVLPFSVFAQRCVDHIASENVHI